jgi:hypothetical protein
VAGYESGRRGGYDSGELGDATPVLEANRDRTVLRYPELDAQLVQRDRLNDSLINHTVVGVGFIGRVMSLCKSVLTCARSEPYAKTVTNELSLIVC